MEERTGVYEYSRDIDLQSIVTRGGYFYVNVRYWSDVPGGPTPENQSIWTMRINCQEQTIQSVGHNKNSRGKGPLYKKFPDSTWRVYLGKWEISPTTDQNLLLGEVCM